MQGMKVKISILSAYNLLEILQNCETYTYFGWKQFTGSPFLPQPNSYSIVRTVG